MYYLRNYRKRGAKCERASGDTKRNSSQNGSRSGYRVSSSRTKRVSGNQTSNIKKARSNVNSQVEMKSQISKQQSKAVQVNITSGSQVYERQEDPEENYNRSDENLEVEEACPLNNDTLNDVSNICSKNSIQDAETEIANVYLCCKCGAQFKSKLMIVHHELHHDAYECCKKVKFKSRFVSQTISCQFSATKQFICYCGQTFKSEIGLNAHKSTHKCPSSCQTSTIASFSNSENGNEGVSTLCSLFCLLCSYQPISEWDLKLHISNDHPDLSQYINIQTNSECEQNSVLNFTINYI
ncbi:uncharacterized protein LOC112127163 [Cimex lectularius]|uniref:C2H2-type domain-containing protein n=1 Tax=Cimex lectularius TaxID=79782 RepID=A0A8I6SLS0_CIMLE|nr:uncharacterized protein LOC112127163 [Cimex lectularius]